MDLSEQIRFVHLNEACRKQFLASFTPGSFFTPEQIEERRPDEVEAVEKLVKDLLWASIERRGAVSSFGTEAEEAYLELENKLPSLESFGPENFTRVELKVVQEGIWARAVRFVAEQNLTNAVEIMELYDTVNQPYFGSTWLEAWQSQRAGGHEAI